MDKKKVREAIALLANSAEPFDKAAILLRESLAPPQRFYKGQPVLVRDFGALTWANGFFESINELGQFVVTLEASSTPYWDECKPDPDAVSLPNWIENDHTEKRVEGDFITWEFADGRLGCTTGFVCLSVDVARYCIISLPKWLD